MNKVKLLVFAVLFAGVTVQAQTTLPKFVFPQNLGIRPSTTVVMSAVWTHKYVAADTVITTGKFRDSVYSPWVEPPVGSKAFFTVYVDGANALVDNGAKDTLRANDSLSINFQSSVDGRSVITTTNLGVLIPGSADLDTIIQYAATLVRDSAVMRAPLIRAFIVVKDSSAAARPGLVGNVYSQTVTLCLTGRP